MARQSCRVAVTADWHGYLPPTIPECDLLVVAGDIGLGENYSNHEPHLLYADLAAWLLELPMPVVAIAGNRDFDPTELRTLPWTYLQDEAATVAGLRIWGSPWTNPFGFGWAFNLPEEEQRAVYAEIPNDTQIIVNHGPPLGSCDRTTRGVSVGSAPLWERAIQLPELQLIACGHIHEAYGREGVVVNGSLVDFAYRVTNDPIVVGLAVD